MKNTQLEEHINVLQGFLGWFFEEASLQITLSRRDGANPWNSAAEDSLQHSPWQGLCASQSSHSLAELMVCYFYTTQELSGGRIAIIPLFSALTEMESARFGFFKIPLLPILVLQICATGVRALGKNPQIRLPGFPVSGHLILDFKHSSLQKIFSKLSVNKTLFLLPRRVFLRFHSSNFYEQYLHGLLHCLKMQPKKRPILEVSLNFLSR